MTNAATQTIESHFSYKRLNATPTKSKNLQPSKLSIGIHKLGEMTKYALQHKLYDLYTCLWCWYLQKADGLYHVTMQHFIIFVLLKFVPMITFVPWKCCINCYIAMIIAKWTLIMGGNYVANWYLLKFTCSFWHIWCTSYILKPWTIHFLSYNKTVP